MKNSYVTATELFCGAGGGALGAERGWRRDHVCRESLEDRGASHASFDHRSERSGSTIASPECTKLSQARGVSHRRRMRVDRRMSRDRAAQQSAKLQEVVEDADLLVGGVQAGRGVDDRGAARSGSITVLDPESAGDGRAARIPHGYRHIIGNPDELFMIVNAVFNAIGYCLVARSRNRAAGDAGRMSDDTHASLTVLRVRLLLSDRHSRVPTNREPDVCNRYTTAQRQRFAAREKWQHCTYGEGWQRAG